MSKSCPNCNAGIKPSAPTTPCDGCNIEVHLSCVGLSTDDIRVTRNKSRNIKIICNSCNRFMGGLGEIKALMRTIQDDLKSRFSKLEEKLTQSFQTDINSVKTSISQLQADVTNLKSTSPQPSFQDNSFDDMLNEFTERQKRKNNIVVFGMTEAAELQKEERVELDKARISEILEFSNITRPDHENLKVIRLGRFTPNKSRPIKVILDNEELVKQIIRKAKDMRRHDQFKGIFVSYDKTPRQMDQYQQVKRNLNERLSNGETNLRIMYVNGNPIIKSLNQ